MLAGGPGAGGRPSPDTIDPAGRSSSLAGHQGPIHGLAFSRDGKWLVSGGADGTVRLWRLTDDGATAGPVLGGGRYGAVDAVAISPNGEWLAFGTEAGNVCVWKKTADGYLEAPCEVGKDRDPVMTVPKSHRPIRKRDRHAEPPYVL